MKGEKKREEKKDVYSVIENFSFKKILRYRFYLLLLFFLFTGIISYIVLTSEAEKLAGGKKYTELSSSSSRLGFSLIEKLKYTVSLVADKFQSSSSSLSNKKEDNNKDEKGEDEYSEGSTGFENEAKNVYNRGDGGRDKSSEYLASSWSVGYKKNTLESELAHINDRISGGGVSKTSLSTFDSYSSPKVKITDSKSSIGVSYGKKGNENKTALDLLKSTFKASLMAARDASNDTARAWTSKSFDYTPDIKQTIEYDEKLKANLDRINPNSIPAFLKDPALDPENMKSLKVSDVPGLSSEEEEKSEQNKNEDFLAKLANINPLFSMQSTDKDNKHSESEIDNKSYSVNPQNPNVATSPKGDVITDPSQQPNLGNGISTMTTDEYGYIRVTGSDGVVHIFDPNTGKIVGCEDPNVGMCLLPGAGSCPAELYFV